MIVIYVDIPLLDKRGIRNNYRSLGVRSRNKKQTPIQRTTEYKKERKHNHHRNYTHVASLTNKMVR